MGKWAREPRLHRQVLAAMFGRCLFEASNMGINERGRILLIAHPWAKRLESDLNSLRDEDGDFYGFGDLGDGGVHNMFADDPENREVAEVFVLLDFSQILI